MDAEERKNNSDQDERVELDEIGEGEAKTAPRVRRLRPWFGIAIICGVAGATAAVWVSGSHHTESQSPDPGVRNERPDDSWLNHEPDHLAANNPTPAAVSTPAPVQPSNLPSYQPAQTFQSAPTGDPQAEQRKQEYQRALASDIMVGESGQSQTSHGALEIPRLVSPQASDEESGQPSNSGPITVSPHPASAYTITAGTVLYGTLETGINSDLPGEVLGRIGQDVKDSVTQTYVLIPQGSKLIGSYDRDQITPQQDRLFVIWRRIVFPNGGEIQLPDLPGTDQAGYTGFEDQVNHHYVKVWTPALLMSAISAGMMMAQSPVYAGGATGGYYVSPSQMAAMGAGQELGQVGISHLGTATAETRPTIEIRPGYNFRVMVTRDLVFSGPYNE